MNSLLRGVEPALGSGRRRVDWVYVEDVVDALLAAAVEPSAVGHVVDIGTGQPVTIREAVGLVRDVIGTPTRPAFGRRPDRTVTSCKPWCCRASVEVAGADRSARRHRADGCVACPTNHRW